MFGIGGNGGLFGGIANIALQAAMGIATGGMSTIVQMALKSVMLAAGDQIIQQIGQSLGLPQPVIDGAQAAFHGAAGDVAGAQQNMREAAAGLASVLGGNDFDAGEIERSANEGAKDAANDIIEQIRENNPSSIQQKVQGKSLLIAIAIALGSVADEKMNDMYNKTMELGNLKQGDKGYASLSGEISGLGQELKLVTEGMNNAIKSIGEGASTLARKQ